MQLGQPLIQRQIVWIVMILVLFGQVILFSASGVLGLSKHHSEFYFVIRQSSAALIGIALLVLLAHIRLTFFRKLAFFILFVQIALVAATYFPGMGLSGGGARRWLSFSGFVFQPSETAKISLSLYLAHILSAHLASPYSAKKWGILLFPVLVLLGLVFKQPDMGTTVLLVIMTLAIFFVAGVRFTYVLYTVGAATAGFAIAMLHSDYRRRRLFAFLNPWADPQGTGFQTIQSLVSFHSGKLFGTGIGNGNSKLFYLPEVHTDFIYALVAEELGFIGAALLLLTFLYLLYLLFRTSSKATESFGSLLAFGLTLSLALQICVNLGGVTGLIPVKGLPLPFISWGRSALISNLAMIGILLNVARQSEKNTST